MHMGGGGGPNTEISENSTGENSLNSFDSWMMTEAPTDEYENVILEDFFPGDSFPGFEVPFRNIRFLGWLGSGNYGETWSVKVQIHGEESEILYEAVLKILPNQSNNCLSLTSSNLVVRRLTRVVEALQNRNSKWICCPHSFTVLENDQIGILMPRYKKSVLDIMTSEPEKRLGVEEFLRLGARICGGMRALHEDNILALNLKPSNILIDESGEAVVGAFGIPWLISENIFLDPQNLDSLGTSNYSPPEQWAPAVNAPLCKESDVWSFACLAIEILTGRPPWGGFKPSEIFEAVVVKKEKPQLPSGLPNTLATVLQSCFRYDPRERPSFAVLERVFSGSRELYHVGDWIVVQLPSPNLSPKPRMGVITSVSNNSETVEVQFCERQAGDTLTFKQDSIMGIVKDPIAVGDTVCLKRNITSPSFGWCESDDVFTSLSLTARVEEVSKTNAYVGLSFPYSSSNLPTHRRADPWELERTSGGLVCGDWIRLNYDWSQWEYKSLTGKPSDIGIVWAVNHDGTINVAISGPERLLEGLETKNSFVQKVKGFTVGQFVRLKSTVEKAKYPWPICSKDWKMNNLTNPDRSIFGRIDDIYLNGLLVLRFPGCFVGSQKQYVADPSEVEVVRLSDFHGLVPKIKPITTKRHVKFRSSKANCYIGMINKEEYETGTPNYLQIKHWRFSTLLQVISFNLAHIALGFGINHLRKKYGSKPKSSSVGDSDSLEPRILANGITENADPKENPISSDSISIPFENKSGNPFENKIESTVPLEEIKESKKSWTHQILRPLDTE